MQVLSAEDLVPDEPLGYGATNVDEKDDLLHHRVLARRAAELAVSSGGNVNIALFGPWGAGKSSFNALLRQELRKQSVKTRHITFDAWKNAGAGFRTNFLSELARQLKVDEKISDRLFQSTSSVQGPLADLKWSRKRRLLMLIAFLGVIFFGLPAAWTLFQILVGAEHEFVSLFGENVAGFANMAAGGTLFVVVALAVIELSKVTVSKSTPSHVAQFGKLFEEILATKKKHRFVIFVDELDRCSPEDVMTTLEGLRTFLGHRRCVFVVAFDREAVAGVIANQLKDSAPRESAVPYYRTSGEYLDKIFQFQLALPPQPVHTFRRFASSLVRNRGGVWAQLRSYHPELLDRVVNILSPMHLASPRRTKVLLNDFAVNARIYEGMNFNWLDRAEEIAVLTVLQTEFPRLAADLEREPALMRFLYRQESPTRPTLVELVSQYVGDRDTDSAPLDDVVGDKEAKAKVKEQLEDNLDRYLRLLRERNVPEPRADLIMMHSDGSLLAFDDPGVYHELLSAADMPRQDLHTALEHASDNDRGRAVRYLLDQTEKEAKEVSDRLVVLSGEVAAGLATIQPDLARMLNGRVTSAVSGMTVQSLEGYARAATVAYTRAEMQTILQVAEAQTGAGVTKVISSLLEAISDSDWITACMDILPAILSHAVVQPDVASAFFVRYSQDIKAELNSNQIAELAAALTAIAPEPVEPAAATAAARTAAEEQDEANNEAYEQQREAYRGIATEITAEWTGMALGSELRRDLLRVLRRVEDDDGFLDIHDSLINRDIDRGQRGEANSLLLDAISDLPESAWGRWGTKLDANESVSGSSKGAALHAVMTLFTDSSNESVREGCAFVARRIANLESDEFDPTESLALIRNDLGNEWEEYSDTRFEAHLNLIAVLDRLDSDTESAEQDRERLYVTAVNVAQTDPADLDLLVSSLESESPAFAARTAAAISSTQPWEEDNPELPLRVILAAQHRALAGSVPIARLPATAMAGLDDSKVARSLAASWLSTAPPVSEVAGFANAPSLPTEAWRRFGGNSGETQRGEAWRFLVKKGAAIDRLRALSLPGQAVAIYEQTGKAVREAKTIPQRERALHMFLALPVRRQVADEVRAMVKVMAQDGKRGELALGVLLLRAYAEVLPAAAIRSLRPLVSAWAESAEGLVAKRDITWLVDHEFATKSSSLWDVVKRMSRH